MKNEFADRMRKGKGGILLLVCGRDGQVSSREWREDQGVPSSKEALGSASLLL